MGLFTIFTKRNLADYPELKSDKRRMEHINVLYGLLTDFLQDGELLPNMSEFMGIYGRVGSAITS